MAFASSRSILLRDLLSQDLIERIDAAQSPAPLFSPTQIRPFNNIVDRSAGSGSASSASVAATSNCKDKENRTPPSSTNVLAATFTIATPCIKACPLQQPSTVRHNMRTPTCFGLSPINEDMFFSPAQSNQSLRDMLTPDVSATPYKSLPNMEVLRLEQIQQCTNHLTLQEIVKVLQEDNRAPSLLRAATNRLAALGVIRDPNSYTGMERLQHSSNQADSNQRPTIDITRASSSPSPVAVESTSQQSSSLIFSMDSGERTFYNFDEESVAPEPLPPTAVQPESLSILPQRRVKKTFNAALGEIHQQCNGLEVPSTSNKLESNDLTALYAEVENLTQQLRNMETMRWHDQQDFWEQLESLELAKTETEQTIHTLRKQAKQSDQSRLELLEALERHLTEKQELSEALVKQEQAWALRNREHQELQRQLQNKVMTLTATLKIAQSQRVCLQGKNDELNQSLVKARHNLLEIKLEQNQMLQAIIRFNGVDANTLDISQLTPQQRHDILHEFRTQVAASKSALLALSEAIKTAEEDRARAVRCYHKTYALWKQESDRGQRRESDNRDLAKQLVQLSEELANARFHVADVLQSTSVEQQKAWEKREAKYQELIKKLKSQICLQEPQVPIALYRKAIMEARDKPVEAGMKDERGDCLSATITGLTVKRDIVKLSTATDASEARKTPKSALKATTVSGVTPLREPKKRVTLQGSATKHLPHSQSDKNNHLKTPQRHQFSEDKENDLAVHNVSSAKCRHSTLSVRRRGVQKSGGLKALKKRYKNVRSPVNGRLQERMQLAIAN